jgi:hypothetical protein
MAAGAYVRQDRRPAARLRRDAPSECSAERRFSKQHNDATLLLLAYLLFDYDTSNKPTAGRPDHIDGIASFDFHPHSTFAHQLLRLGCNRHIQIPSGLPVYG